MSDRAVRTPRAQPEVLVAVGAALSAVGLGGHGLLVPAGPGPVAVRLFGAVVALVAVGVLVRLDGPARGTRTLAVVAVAGAFTAVATLPSSPVTVFHAAARDAGAAQAGDAGTGTVLLDGVDGVRPVEPSVPAGGAIPDAGASGVDGGAVGAPVGSAAGAPPTADPVPSAVPPTVVVDGVVVTVPAPLPSPSILTPADPADPLVAEGIDGVLAVLLACFALLAFAPPVVRVADRLAASLFLDPPTDDDEHGVVTSAAAVEAGLSDALRAMLADPDPRTAVIGAYAGLLEALAAAGAPRLDAETPHEHLWRALGSLGVRRAPLHRLAELFVQARFTPRPLTDEHRQAAINALADAVADLRLGGHGVADVLAEVPG